MGNALFTDALPVERAPLVVKFDEAVQARSGKGINFNGAVVYAKGANGWEEVARGDPFFLFGQAIGKGAITNPFELRPRWSEKNEKHYWNLHGMEGKPEVVAKDPPPETSSYGGGGNGKGGSSIRDLTPQQVVDAFDYAKLAMRSWDKDPVAYALVVSKLAASMLVRCEPSQWGSAQDAPEHGVSADEVPWEDEAAPAIDDKDIPFAWLLPLVGLLWMA